jgi:hypothetical protein
MPTLAADGGLDTLLNAKGLIFGLVLLPRWNAREFLPHLGFFALSVLLIAVIWTAAGTLFHRNGGGAESPLFYRRLAACWLGVLRWRWQGACSLPEWRRSGAFFPISGHRSARE